jgi:hypothetical protein
MGQPGNVPIDEAVELRRMLPALQRGLPPFTSPRHGLQSEVSDQPDKASRAARNAERFGNQFRDADPNQDSAENPDGMEASGARAWILVSANIVSCGSSRTSHCAPMATGWVAFSIRELRRDDCCFRFFLEVICLLSASRSICS